MKKIMLFVMALGAMSAIVPTSCKPQHQPEWQLVWEENFDQGDAPVDSIWSRIPRGGNDWNNYMTMHDTCFDVRDGKMILRGIVNTVAPEDTAPYLTGGVYTKGKKGFQNGRIEVSAKLHGATGCWPAIWLMPEERTEPWPYCGEIDVMERLNYDSIVYQTVHSGYTYVEGIKDNPVSGVTAPINVDDFNVYGVEMGNDSLVFYVNGIKTNVYPRLQPEVEGQYPYGGKDYYLKLDMQLGGNWVGEVDPADLPVEMEIDWVRFYQQR